MSKVNPCLQIETLDLILFLPMASCLLIKFFMKRKFHCFHLRMRRKLVWGSNRVRFQFSLSCVSCIAVIYYEFDKVFSTDVNVNMIMKIHLWKVFSWNRLPLKELKQFHWNTKEERWLTYVSMGGGGWAVGRYSGLGSQSNIYDEVFWGKVAEKLQRWCSYYLKLLGAKLITRRR